MSPPFNTNVVNIANLPSDIVRRIIGVGLESVEGLRLISHRWNSLALEHLSHRERLPDIKNICWHIDFSGVFLNPIVRIANKYRNYFGLQYWAATSTALDNEVEVSYGRLPNNPEKKVSFGERIACLIKRCSSVKRLQFTGHCNNINLNFIKKVLGDVDVQELAIDYHYNSGRSILEVLRIFPAARQIILSVDRDELLHALQDATYPTFLRDIVRMVEIAELTVKYPLKEGWTPQDAQAHMIHVVERFSQETGINIHFDNMECGADRIVTIRIIATEIKQ